MEQLKTLYAKYVYEGVHPYLGHFISSMCERGHELRKIKFNEEMIIIDSVLCHNYDHNYFFWPEITLFFDDLEITDEKKEKLKNLDKQDNKDPDILKILSYERSCNEEYEDKEHMVKFSCLEIVK